MLSWSLVYVTQFQSSWPLLWGAWQLTVRMALEQKLRAYILDPQFEAKNSNREWFLKPQRSPNDTAPPIRPQLLSLSKHPNMSLWCVILTPATTGRLLYAISIPETLG